MRGVKWGWNEVEGMLFSLLASLLTPASLIKGSRMLDRTASCPLFSFHSIPFEERSSSCMSVCCASNRSRRGYGLMTSFPPLGGGLERGLNSPFPWERVLNGKGQDGGLAPPTHHCPPSYLRYSGKQFLALEVQALDRGTRVKGEEPSAKTVDPSGSS